MLVLTRKPGERVLIGDDIVITILEGRGDGIRIGIDAPRGVKIQRAEIVQAVTEANVAAAELSSGDAEEQLKAALGLALPATPPAGDAAGSDSAGSDSAVADPAVADPADRAAPSE